MPFVHFFCAVYYRYVFHVRFIELSVSIQNWAVASGRFFVLLGSFAVEGKQ